MVEMRLVKINFSWTKFMQRKQMTHGITIIMTLKYFK